MKRKYLLLLISLMFFGCHSPEEKETDGNNQEEPEIVDMVVPEIPQIDKTLKIWTIGDSITLGSQNGYRNRIWTVMTDAGNSIDFIGTQTHPYPNSAVCPDADHDGYSGNTISDIDGKISALFETVKAEKPDVLLIMLGTNDLAWWVPNEDFVSGSDERMLALAEKILNLDPDMAVIIGTIPPMSEKIIKETKMDRADYAAAYNSALTVQVKNHPLYGSRLFLAETGSILTVNDLYDGIHPTLTGYDRLGDAWLKALVSYMDTADL